MTVITTSVFNVVKRFPYRKDAVKRLFNKSETFQAICEDYRKCAVALEHWKYSTSEKAPARREEYATLLQGLEAEILQSLNGVR